MEERINSKEPTIWQNKIFMKLFASYSVSMLGHWFDMVAIIILFSYVWHTSPLVIALIPVAFALPQVLFGQIAGVLTDKFHKVKIMMISDFTTAVLTVLLLFTNTPWIALVIISLRSAVNVVHSPAQQGLIKLVVEERLILKAVTLNGTVNHLSKIIGPFVGATLIGFVSPKLCILINAIAFTISAFILLFILLNKEMAEQTTVKKDDETQKSSFWSSWREGWSVVLRTRVLYVSLTAVFLGFTALQMVDFQFPVLFREIAPHLPEIAGWLMGATGLGAVTMIMILNRFKTLTHYGWLFGASMLLIGAAFGGLGFLREGFMIWIPVALGFVGGLGVGLLTITFQFMIQTETTDKDIGRVSGIASSVISLTVLISPLVGGFLVQQFGVVAILLTSGTSLVVLGTILVIGDSSLFKRGDASKEQLPLAIEK
ncbi:MFS transporter [Bacillus shivajii]|uniref:MFS transporter n=1 Tax=Bacillus shivajii TaxID=1983719 RepID=UPI001CFC0C3C|nr:MFS transporter [Bacillus shivajii]UCZ53428.1 MFS transporter [Bacillus shivajii]